LDKRKFLNAVVFFQYAPRVLRIYISWMNLTRTASKLARLVWVKAAFNFFLYILASHVSLIIFYIYIYISLIINITFILRNHKFLEKIHIFLSNYYIIYNLPSKFSMEYNQCLPIPAKILSMSLKASKKTKMTLEFCQ
jgi:hypothetical protein